MEDRKIIYLNLNNIKNKEITKIVDELEIKLKESEYIVYRNEDEKIEEIIKLNNKIKPDIYISFNVNNIENKKGPIIYTNSKNTNGDNISKRIHEQLKLIYYDYNNIEDIVYTNNISEILNITSPVIYIELYSSYDKNDILWFKENNDKIMNAMYLGIDNYFKGRK